MKVELDETEYSQLLNEIVQLKKYKEGYYILMEYWDSLPDEEKPDIDRRMKELGI